MCKESGEEKRVKVSGETYATEVRQGINREREITVEF